MNDTPSTALIGTPAIRSILTGRFCSAAISTILMVVFSIRVIDLTDNVILVGVIVALRMVGSALGALVAPRLSRVLGLPRLLLNADLAAAVIVVIAALVPASGEVSALLVAAFVLGVTFVISNITMISVGPELVGKDQKHVWNGRVQTAQALAVVFSGLLTGLIYASGPVLWLLVISAIGFVITGFITSFHAPNLPDEPPTSAAGTLNSGITQAVAAAVPLIFVLLIVARAGEALGSGVHNVGFLLLSAEYDIQNQATLAGWLLAAWGVGKVVSGFAVPPILGRHFAENTAMTMVFMATNILTFCFFLAVFQVDTLLLYIVFAFLAGLFDAATEISYYSCMQVDSRSLRDRLLNISYAVERLALFSGILIAGWVLEIIPLVPASALIYGGTILLVLLSWVVLVLAIRSADAKGEKGKFNDI